MGTQITHVGDVAHEGVMNRTFIDCVDVNIRHRSRRAHHHGLCAVVCGQRCANVVGYDEVADAKARRDSKSGRMGSLLGGFGSAPRSPYNHKRSYSALATAPSPSRVVRMLTAIGPSG